MGVRDLVITDRDEAILAHIGRYRVSLASIISREFFGGRNPRNVLQRLQLEKRIQSWPLSGPLRYYQLTVREARRRGLPKDRGTGFGPRAVQLHLAVLWYCFCEGTARKRREPAELRKLLGVASAGRAHVTERRTEPKEMTLVLRVQLLSEQAEPADVVKSLRKMEASDLDNEKIAPWLLDGWYGYRLLTSSASALERIKSAVHAAGGRFHTSVRCLVVPPPEAWGR